MMLGKRKHRALFGVMIVIFVLFFVGIVHALEKEEPQVPPSKAIISDVPYISWAEAAHLDYQDKNILNPSFAASLAMILKYWGQNLDLLKDAHKALPEEPGGWGVVEERKGKSFDELKPFIARGMPVIVFLPLTPVAHIPTPQVAAYVEILGVEKAKEAFGRGNSFKMSKEQYKQFKSVIEGESPGLGVFRKMWSLDTLRQFGRPAWESLLLSTRVVIGYDADRKVVILHDPSFGPAWEVSYEDFEKMWKAIEALDWNYIVAYPPDYMKVLAKRTHETTPYPPRTPDQQAAVHFVFGYALSSVGRTVEAEKEIRNGLAIPGIGKGYQHLLLFELARIYRSKGNTGEAIATALQAIPLLPEHHRPYRFLSELYSSSTTADRKQKSDEAEEKAKALCMDRDALKTVAKTLGHDFFIFGCGGLQLLGGPFQ